MSQLSPSQALTIIEGYCFTQKDQTSLGIPVTRHFDNGKTRPVRPPDLPTNPDRSRTYLVIRAHRMGQATSKTSPEVSLRWPPRLPISDQHSEEHWPGGVKIKMTLGFATPRKSYKLLGKYKTKDGPYWRNFIQRELSRGTHNPNRVRNAKSRNITPVWWKLRRQEWKKTPGTRPSLPPFTKYIDALIK